jgi:hypothetical protein
VSFGAVAPFVLVLGFEVLRGVLGVNFGLVVVVGGGGDVFVHSNQLLPRLRGSCSLCSQRPGTC